MKLKLVALCTLALATLAPTLALNATAASASSWVTVDSPYVHSGVFNRWVETNAYVQGCCGKTKVESTLYQYYGGAWHQVADASNTSSDYGNKVKSYVYCGSPYTNYSFQARGRAWFYGPTGWVYEGETWSAVVTRAC